MKKTYKKLGIALIILVILLVVAFFSLQTKGDQESKLSKKLEEVGSDFYTNFYHGQITSDKTEEESTEFLSRFNEKGIKVDLDNLSRFNEQKYSDLLETFVNKKTKIACDQKNTRAIIYPQEPYGDKDFTIKGELDCGFDVTE